MGGYRGQGQTRTLRMRTILVNNNNNKRSQCKWGGGRGTNVMLMRSSGTERIFNQLVRNDGNELSNRLVGYWLSYITSITDRNMRPLLRQNIFFFFLIIPWVPITREEKIPAGIPINIPQPEVTETGASYAHAIWIKSLFLRPTGQWWHKSAPAVGSLNFVNDVLFEMLISLIGPNSRWIWTIQLWLHSVYSIPILNIREVTHIHFCMFRLRALAAIYSPMRIIPHVPWILDEIESASVTQLSRRLKRGQGRWVFDRLVEKIIPYITQLHIALTKWLPSAIAERINAPGDWRVCFD